MPTIKRTTDAIKIIEHSLLEDPELAAMVEEERKKLKLAEKIRDARQKAGLTQVQVARRIGSTQSAIARLECGAYERLSLSTLLKVSLALNCRMHFELEPVG